MNNIYMLKGKTPVECEDGLEWNKQLGSTDRRVGNYIKGKVIVSTVFLGIDHNFSNQGKPILFETMVFGGEFDGEQERYCTWEEAEKGHKEMVEKVNKKEKL